MKLSYKRCTLSVPLRCMQRLKRRMRWVRAAGCIVADEEGNRLLISRNGRWDLPKGKQEPGESLLHNALRETQEETGIAAVPDGQFPLLAKTYHCYNLYGGWHLKQTSWFAARCQGVKPQGTPQGEEGIAAVEWVRPDEWRRRLGHSYGTMRILSRL